jgi:hypothetical protein
MGRLPKSLTAEITPAPNFESRSNKRNLCAGTYGHASPQLLHDPESIGVAGDIEGQNPAPVVGYDKKTI